MASVPTGNSLGSYEANEIGDGDFKRYNGRGVLQAVSKINEIIKPRLIGLEIREQEKIDQTLIELDGLSEKKNLGTNIMIGVSLACARAGAISAKQDIFVYLKEIFSLDNEASLPVPLFNVFSGGQYADTNLDFQEFLLIPKKSSVSKMIETGASVFHELGNVLKEAGYDTDTGLEGGYAPDLDSSIEAIEFILAAALRSNLKPGSDIFLGIDVGSTLLYEEASGHYVFPLDNNHFTSANNWLI